MAVDLKEFRKKYGPAETQQSNPNFRYQAQGGTADMGSLSQFREKYWTGGSSTATDLDQATVDRNRAWRNAKDAEEKEPAFLTWLKNLGEIGNSADPYAGYQMDEVSTYNAQHPGVLANRPANLTKPEATAQEKQPVTITPPATPIMSHEQQRAMQFAETKRREGEAARAKAAEKPAEQPAAEKPATLGPLDDSWRVWNQTTQTATQPTSMFSTQAEAQEKPQIDYTSEEVQKQKADLEAQRTALVQQATELSMYGAEYTEEIEELKGQISALDEQIDALQKPMTFKEHAASAGTAVVSGLEGAGLGVTNALEWLLGERSLPWAFLNELATLVTGQESPLAGKNPITALQRQGQQEVEYWQNQAAIQAAGNDVAEKVGKHAASIAQSSPFILMNLLSLGVAGTAAAGTTEGASYVASINSSPALQQISTIAVKSLEGLASNPTAQYSFVSTFGSSYQDALNEGATEAEATVYALLNGAFGTIVEMGGGLEAMPEQLLNAMQGGNTSFALEYAKDIAHEIGEEEIQRVLELGLKFGYSDVEWLDQENPDAILNLESIGETAVDTAIDTAVMGAAQSALQYGANAAINAVQPLQQASETDRAYAAWRAALGDVLNDIDMMNTAEDGRGNQAPATKREAVERRFASEAQEQVDGILSGESVSNSKAEQIINDPELAQAFTEMTGVELTGTKSEQRRAVKDAAANYGNVAEDGRGNEQPTTKREAVDRQLGAVEQETVTDEAAQTVAEEAAEEKPATKVTPKPRAAAQETTEEATAKKTTVQVRTDNRKAVMGGIIQNEAEKTGAAISEEERAVLAEAFDTKDGVKGRAYAAAVVEAYQLGSEGKVSLEEARRASTKGTTISGEQFERAYELGRKASQSAALESNLQGLGRYAGEAVDVFEDGQDAAAYGSAMTEAVNNYAAQGVDVMPLVQSDRKSGGALGILTDAQVAKAMEIGERIRQRNTAAAQSRGEQLAGRKRAGTKQAGRVTYASETGTVGGVSYNAVNKSKLSGTQKAVASIAEGIARFSGLDIRVADFGEGIGGAYVPGSGGVLYLNINASFDGANIAAGSLGHELTHFLQEYASSEYAELKKVIAEEFNKNPEKYREIFGARQATQANLSPDEITDEMAANACQTILSDADVVQNIVDNHKGLAQKIRDFIMRIINDIKAAFSEIDTGSDFTLYQEVRAAEGAMDQIRELWLNAFGVATENLQAEKAEIGSYNLEDFQQATGTDGKPLFQIYAFKHDEQDYRDMLMRWGKMSETQVDELFSLIDTAMAKIEANLEALDYAWEEDINDRAFQPIKQNSDKLYKVSQDFSTLCRKRLLQGLIAGQLSASLQRGLSKEEGIAVRDALLAIQEEGKQIEVACALCYVESARMRSQKAIQEFLNDRAGALQNYFAGKTGKEAVAEAEKAERQAIYDELYKTDSESDKPESEWGLLRGKGDDKTLYDVRDAKAAKMSVLPTPIKKRIQDAKKAAKTSYSFTEKQQSIVDEAMSLPVEEYTTPEGLQDLAKHHREIFNAFVLKVAAASKSKGIENDTWWRAGDSASVGDTLIEQMNAENGLRTQSWSDFQVKHLMDYIAATIEMSTRNAKQHAYTKVLDYVHLMGNTGVMINMSLIPTREFNGKLEYDDVEGIKHKEAFQLRIDFPDTAGTICIGMDEEQIRMLLESDLIDYVIPYHQSGMSKDTRAKMHIPAWKDYQDFQGEKRLSGDAARENAAKYGVELLSDKDPHWHEPPKFSDWFDLRVAQQEAKLAGKEGKYGVMTGGYTAMRNAADTYKRLCAERGLLPKFSYGRADFSNEPNYWKLLIDRKMVNNVTGDIIEQKPLQPVFDFNTVQRILDEELARYGTVKKDQEEAIQRVTGAFLRGEVKGGMSSEQIKAVMQKPVDNIPITNITQNTAIATAPSDVRLNDAEMQMEAQEGARVQFSRWVEDEDTLKFLDEQEKAGKVVRTYKSFLEIDGKLYPPMASMTKENGKWKMAHAMEVGRWEESVGDPSKIIVDPKTGKGYFQLKKDNGKDLRVAYNPYQHSSNLMLNDQFSSAYARPNLATFECIIPESELTSGYQAEYAKDPVGRMAWKSGGVANQIAKAKGIKRDVFLSRWLKPVRKVPDAEVAQHYKELLDGTDIAVPSNVVTPSLLSALEDAGVKIEYTPQAPKAQLQAWSDGDIYQNRALVSEETLDKWMTGSWYGANDPNYAQAFITYMSPREFLDLTTIYDKGRIYAEAEGRTMEWMKEISKGQPIQLHIDTETGQVTGHEGRHRMAVLEREGVREVPVLLFDMGNKYSKQPTDSMTLLGQELNGHYNVSKATVNDVWPLRRQYREEIVQRYSKQKTSERLLEKSGEQQVRFQKWDGVEDEAVKHFGTTNDFRSAGYMLDDGRLLDFSGRHWSSGGKQEFNGTRYVDHEDVFEAFQEIDPNSPSDSALQFIKRGNIRVVPEISGLEMFWKKEPSADQYEKIREYIRAINRNPDNFGGEYFTVDFTKDRTRHDGSLRYEGRINADRVINDIKYFYKTGEVREQGLSAFFQTWDQNNLDVSGENRYNIAKTAEDNFGHLMEVLGYDSRNSGPRGQNGPAERQRLERIEGAYRESTVRSQRDRNDLCDAVRRAGGIQQRRVNIGPYVHADLNIFSSEFYTAEMLHAEAANKARGISTVFFTGEIVDEYGYKSSLNGFSDPDTKTAYVKYDAKNEKDGNVSDVYHMGGKTVARYEGVQTAAKNSRHERFHQLFDMGDKAAQALFRFVDDVNGKYVQFFDAANIWYQRKLRQDGYDFSDYSQEIAADLYAGTIIFDNEQIRREVRRLVDAIDKNNRDTVTPEGADKNVRYQRWDNNDDTKSERSGRSTAYTRLQNENAILKDTVRALKKQGTKLANLQKQLQLTKDPETRQSDARKLAKALITETGSEADVNRIAGEIKKLGDTLLQADPKTLTEETLKTQARAIAGEILNEAKDSVTLEDEAMDVNPYDAYMSEATEELANRIVMDAMNGVLRPNPPTKADKQKARTKALQEHIQQLKAEQKLTQREAASLYHTIYDLSIALDKAESMYETLRTEADYRAAQIRAEGAARAAEIKARERARANDLLQAQRDHYLNMAERAKERREESAGVTKYRKQVEQKAKKLYELLMTNSNDMHVPEVLKAPLGEFLESLDFTSKRSLAGGDSTKADEKFGARLIRIQQMLANQQSYINGDGNIQQDLGGYIDVSPEILDYLRNMAEMITTAMNMGRTFTVNQMTAQDLKTLSDFLGNLRTAIRNMNTFMANARYETVKEAAAADIEEMNRMGRASERANSEVLKFVGWENGTPYYIMKRLGKGAKSLFDGFAKGWERLAFNAQEIINFTEKAYTDTEVREWKKTIHDITLEDGSKIQMTTAQIMELSMLLGREQAVKHISRGGIRIGDIETKKGTKHDTTHYHLSDGDIRAITGLLTPRQAEVAKKMQRYMADRGAEWGNEISMRRFGYKFYEEGPGYYPIKTDANDRPMADTDAQTNSMFRLLNLSASKALNPKASNALIVGDIFDTFADHMADMAKLNGMGLPILDAIKWFNYKERIDHDDGTYDTVTLQGAMEQAFGEQAQRYFRTLMKDINGVNESGDRGTNLPKKLMSNYKIAAVAANLRVAFLQPTSYVRAMTVLKPKYMVGIVPTRAAYREAMKYSGTAVWKALGYYETDISRGLREKIAHDDSFRDKFAEASLSLAELGDQTTWSMLWTACKRQAKAESPGIAQEALMEKTAELFREVVYSSQVMDSTLTRSEIMRGKTGWTKAMSAFMAEPTLSYNILMNAFSEYDLDARRNGKNGAWARNSGKLGKAFTVYAASAAFAAVVESIADAVRDDDDEEFWEKFKQALWGEGGKWWTGNLSQDMTILGKLPYVKNFISTLQGYTSGDMSVAAFNNLVNVYKIWEETIKLQTGAMDKATKVTSYGKMTDWGKVYKTLQALSQMSGFAVSNLTRDVTAIWNTAMNGRKNEWKIRTYNANALSQSKTEAYEQYVKNTGLSKKQYETILAGANLNGGNVSQDEMGSYLTDALRAGELTTAQANAVWKSLWNKASSKTFADWKNKH